VGQALRRERFEAKVFFFGSALVNPPFKIVFGFRVSERHPTIADQSDQSQSSAVDFNHYGRPDP
jgi:hypothetical protein